MEKLQLKTVKIIRTTRLPLRRRQKIDLESAFDSMHGTFMRVQYEPERGLHGLIVSVGNIGLTIFSNGSVTFAGVSSQKKENDALVFLWNFFLKKCVISE